ncbi:MAG: hypothetical protein LZF62_310146 [Nitrospira sp.]|nr:MAG: hypothetical protein LZF62_310146 [Nitrospira sp.]
MRIVFFIYLPNSTAPRDLQTNCHCRQDNKNLKRGSNHSGTTPSVDLVGAGFFIKESYPL